MTYGGPVGLFGALAGRTGCSRSSGMGEDAASARTPEPDALQRLAREVGLPSLFLLEPGMKAALPFELQLQ